MKGRIGRIIAAAIAAVLVLSMLPAVIAESPARSEEEAQMLERVRRSVVHLYGIGTDESGSRTRWTGTGFAVGIAGEDSDVFLTNWHVATNSGKYTQDQVQLWLLRDDAQFDSAKVPLPDCGIECEVLATTTGYPDVAVLRTKTPVTGYPALPLLSSKRVPDTTPVYALGFPGLQGTRSGTDSGPEDVAITSGAIRDHLLMASAGNTFALIHNAAIRHGFSGGPLVSAAGVVVGQNTYGFENAVSKEFFCAVYTDYSMKLLDDLGIRYTRAEGPSPITVLVADTLHMPDISPAAAYAVFALAAAAAVLFLCYFLKTLREAVDEIRQKLARRRADREEQ